MKQINLVYAFKLKAKWIGELTSLNQKIINYNSVFKENEFPYDVNKLTEEREALKQKIGLLKIEMRKASIDIIPNLIELEEAKDDLKFALNLKDATKEGVTAHRFADTIQEYKAQLNKVQIDTGIEEVKSLIFELQNEIDTHNAKAHFEFEIN